MKRLSGLLILAFAVSIFVGCGDKEAEVKKKEDFSKETLKVDDKGGLKKPAVPNIDNIDP